MSSSTESVSHIKFSNMVLSDTILNGWTHGALYCGHQYLQLWRGRGGGVGGGRRYKKGNNNNQNHFQHECSFIEKQKGFILLI